MISLIKSTFYREKETKKALCQFIMSADTLSFGRECKKFELSFAKWQKRKHCIFLNSGSSANLAIVQALLNLGYIHRGDEVGFSALTWSTDVMPLISLGLNTVPIDVELDTLNVSSRNLNKVLATHDLKMVLLTNALGFCDDIDEIRKICGKKKILLVEDNCESLGTVYKGERLGNFGFASTFSFYVGHHLSTIEGGAICTDNEQLATMVRLVRAHGWDRNLSFSKQAEMRTKYRVNSTFYSRYTFYDLGYNLRTTEINGFIGNTQIQYLTEIINKRRQNFLRLAPTLYSRSDLYYPIRYDHMDLISNFAVPVVCKSEAIRDRLVEICEGKIEIRPIIAGDLTKQPFFKKYMKQYSNPSSTANARLVHKQGLYFGNNPELTGRELKNIHRIFTKNFL